MRQYVLVSYDISDSKRLRQTYKLMRGYGDPVQYSVFLCQLTDKDQVIFIRLGRIDAKNQIGYPEKWQVLGQKIELTDTKVMIF